MKEVNKILNCDCLGGLKKMPDGSIDCCVTSPPYFGLRDYGTAKWEGGDENCNHDFPQGGRNPETSGKQLTNAGTTKHQYRTICIKCNAKRIDNQIGLEETPEAYVSKMVEVFSEVKRVLKKEGTLWLNLGDSYWGGKGSNGNLDKNIENRISEGRTLQRPQTRILSMKTIPTAGKHEQIKAKDLIGIPWMVAFALRSSGWYLRQDIIWHKPNPMPESVTDRCTKSHEYIFLLSKSTKYYYDSESIGTDILGDTIERYKRGWNGNGERGFPNGPQNHIKDFMAADNEKREWANKKSVWTVNTYPYAEAHFATFPEGLIVDMIKAGCPENGIVLDPFMGAGTTALVAAKLNRKYIGFELNADYVKIAEKRLRDELGMFMPNSEPNVQGCDATKAKTKW